MIRLRPYKPCDAERVLSWCGDEETFLLWGGARFGAFPLPAEAVNRKYLTENGDCAEPDNFYPVTACEGSEPVGHFIIRYLHGDPHILRFGWVIVDGSRRGRGIGRQMLTLGLRYAFGILGAEKVTIGVFEHNLPAYRCYRACGFRLAAGQPGQTEEILGEPQRVVEMEINREEFR